MKPKVHEVGDTLMVTWTSSGSNMDSGTYRVITEAGSEIQDARSMTDSGNGHWWSLLEVLSESYIDGEYYVAEVSMIKDAQPYVERTIFRTVRTQVGTAGV